MRTSHILLMVLMTAVTAGLGGCSHVSEDWKAAQAANTTEAYQDFLRQHPDSEFNVTAQERLKQLAEDRDWQVASKTDTLDAYQQFVAAHADGKWAQEARVRIENFQLSGNSQPPAAGNAGATVAPAETAAAAGAAAGAATAEAEEAPPEKAESAAAPPPAVKAAPTIKPSAPVRAKSAAKATRHTAPVRASAGKAAHHHLAQLGAYDSKARAQAAWRRLSSKYPSQLKSLKPHYVLGKHHGKQVVRLQVRLDSIKGSRALCSALKKHSQPCVPLG